MPPSSPPARPATDAPDVPPHGLGPIPDFFIVGHPKCGTTALYAMLKRHPQVYMPDAKEPWFFAEELHERTPPRPEGTPRTLAEYRAWFAHATPGRRVGEASPLYLWSHTAAARIAAVRPDARIVAILREPASFLRSLHLQFLQSYIEIEPDFAKALALEPARREGRRLPRYTYWPKVLLYSEHVRYVEQLRRYLARFPAEQLLVLVYDDFRADNDATVRRVLRFLEVDDTAPVQLLDVNPTVRARSQRADTIVHALAVGRGPLSRATKATIKALAPRRVRRGVLGTIRTRVLYAEPQPPDEATMHELRRRYKHEVVALGDFLQRDLVTLWGYDSVA
jgi:Sulfotransferase domain